MPKDEARSGQELARLRVRAMTEPIPSVVRFVEGTIAGIGLAPDDVKRLGIAVEEACLNVVHHAFDPGEEGWYEVAVEKGPLQVVVAVEDRRLPFDAGMVGRGEQDGLGAVLMRSLADEVAFVNLGRGGKRVELVKALPTQEVGEFLSDEERRRGGEPVDRAPADTPVSLCLLEPDEAQAVGLSRCVCRSYGYTYLFDLLYYPGKILEQLRSGLLRSCVALAPDGTIVGHLGLSFDRPEDTVADSGKAVVDPRFRGRGLFEDMKRFLIDDARSRGMYGIYSVAVTIHPFTQKGNLALGAHETGLLLAFLPEGLMFKRIKGGTEMRRQTVCLTYLKVNQEPERDAYAPTRHAEILLASECSTYCQVRVRAPQVADPTGYGASPPSRRDLMINAGWRPHRIRLLPLNAIPDATPESATADATTDGGAERSPSTIAGCAERSGVSQDDVRAARRSRRACRSPIAGESVSCGL